MTVAHARMLLSKCAVIEPIDDGATARALCRLAAWSLRMVPVSACDESGGILCDATGCDRLYRGFDRLLARFLARVRGFGVTARLAAAPTFGAAWALARFASCTPVIVESGSIPDALQALPIEALRLDPLARDGLRKVGIERVGQLLALPRSSVADRYGPSVSLRVDQALGHAIETIAPLRPRKAIIADRLFDGPTDRLELVQLAARDALNAVCRELTGQESGCRRIDAILDRSDMPPLPVVVRTARPTRDARHLWALLAPRIESAHLGFGVQGVRLVAAGVSRLRHEQAEAWEPRDDTVINDRVSQLVDTLNARFGIGSVLRMNVRESHIPERVHWAEPVQELDAERRPASELPEADRPGVLYDRPRRAEVVLLVPEGPIASVRHGGVSERVVACVGPERIEPEWWRPGADGARDYYRLLTETGRVLWMRRHGREWSVDGVWV
jgi:protein ImuB